MKAFIEGNSIRVILSERNLRELLAEFERNPRSATLLKRQDGDRPFITVSAEADETHYAYRDERKVAA